MYMIKVTYKVNVRTQLDAMSLQATRIRDVAFIAFITFIAL